MSELPAAEGPKAYDIAKILAALPHRYPLLLVDRVVNLGARRADPRGQGGQLQRAVLPGAFPRPADHARRASDRGAGAGGRDPGDRDARARRQSGKLVYFMAIDEAKFRAPVEPGCLLDLKVGFVQKRARVCKFWGKAIGRGQADLRGRVHRDDRRSAEALMGIQPCRLDEKDCHRDRYGRRFPFQAGRNRPQRKTDR